jgi:hypothetical protein
MVGKHLGTYIGFWADPEDAKWAEAEAERRGLSKSRILAEALSEYRDSRTGPEDQRAPVDELPGADPEWCGDQSVGEFVRGRRR